MTILLEDRPANQGFEVGPPRRGRQFVVKLSDGTVQRANLKFIHADDA